MNYIFVFEIEQETRDHPKMNKKITTTTTKRQKKVQQPRRTQYITFELPSFRVVEGTIVDGGDSGGDGGGGGGELRRCCCSSFPVASSLRICEGAPDFSALSFIVPEPRWVVCAVRASREVTPSSSTSTSSRSFRNRLGLGRLGLRSRPVGRRSHVERKLWQRRVPGGCLPV